MVCLSKYIDKGAGTKMHNSTTQVAEKSTPCDLRKKKKWGYINILIT